MENLRKWGLHTHCPLCRAKLPPGPEQLFEVGGRKFLRVELRIIHGNRMKHQFLSKNGTRWGALTAEEQAIMERKTMLGGRQNLRIIYDYYKITSADQATTELLDLMHL